MMNLILKHTNAKYESYFANLLFMKRMHFSSCTKNHYNLLTLPQESVFPLPFKLNIYCLIFPICQSSFLHSSIIHCVQLSNIAKNEEVYNCEKPNMQNTGKWKKTSESSSSKIKLLDMYNKVSIMSLESATKIADHRHLRLVKLEDGNEHSKPLYKLLKNPFAEDETLVKKSLKSGVKGEKHLIINDNIGVSDLEVKLKKITGFLDKSFEVIVLIQSSSSSTTKDKLTESVAAVQKSVEGKVEIVQKQNVSKGVKIKITPIQKTEKKT